MIALFSDRQEAGQQLAAKLSHLAGREKLIVLGLPRGGVPVAAEVARALGTPLDVFVVRKLGVPGQEELAMGAVASGGVRVENEEVIRSLGITRRTLDDVTEAEQRELARREREYRHGRPFPTIRDGTVVLVDDGVATGSTMMAAVKALRQQGPAAIVVAAPVMSRSAQKALSRLADDCVVISTPEPFYGVGAWYQDFSQTTDEEVRALLEPGLLGGAGAASGTARPEPPEKQLSRAGHG
jgi:predicted phosphoribosyltransferase